MRVFSIVLLAAVVSSAASVIAVGQTKVDVAKEDMKKLQGVWQVTKWVDHDEEPAPAEEIKYFTFEFKGDHLTTRREKGDSGTESKYALNPSKQPKWIDLDTKAPVGALAGIYKLDGDELTICVVAGSRGDKIAPRPSEFKASKREKYTLFVLKRVKK